MKIDLIPYALVFLGGFAGAVLRFWTGEVFPSPAGTLIVNFSGCVVMGIFMYESIYIGAFDRRTRVFFATGVVGSFTTFSALAVESFGLGPVAGTAYMAGSILLGLLGVLAGRHIISYQRGI